MLLAPCTVRHYAYSEPGSSCTAGYSHPSRVPVPGVEALAQPVLSERALLHHRRVDVVLASPLLQRLKLRRVLSVLHHTLRSESHVFLERLYSREIHFPAENKQVKQQ